MLAPGATLGFHRPWIVKESEKRFYEANRIKEKWEEEFDYVPWIYDVAIGDVVEGITFLRGRGVDMDFILKIYSTSSYDMWEPSRDELLESRSFNKIIRPRHKPRRTVCGPWSAFLHPWLLIHGPRAGFHVAKWGAPNSDERLKKFGIPWPLLWELDW